MAKKDMIDLDSVILEERSKTDIDEELIANISTKPFAECYQDFKVIDKKYDDKFEALSAEKKKRYHEHYSNLIEERKEMYKLLEKSDSVEEKKKYFDQYINTIGKTDALFALAEKDDDKTKAELIEFKKDDKKQAIVWMVAGAAVPIVAKVVWEGIKALAKSFRR